MSIDQKVQTLQIFKQFITAKSANDPVYAEIAEELGKIGGLLNNRRLTLAVFSQFSLLAEALSNVFARHQTLSQFYQPIVRDLASSQTATAITSPTLTLKANPQVGQTEAQYKLSANQSIVIGRDLQYQNDPTLVQIPMPMYKKVSGRHAEIQSVSNLGSATTSWQICDLDSRNGTYINGQKIKGCQVLRSGDRITLSYPSSSDKAPEFIFKNQATTSTPNTSSTTLPEADLIFLGIHPTQGLSLSEKQLIEQVSKAKTFGFVIIADISGTTPQQAQSIQTNLDNIKSWARLQFPQLADNLEVVSLPIYPFYPNVPFAPLTPEVGQQFSEFADPFIELAKSQGAELFEQRIHQQLQIQIQRVEQIISNQENRLKNEIQKSESSLNGRTLKYWVDHTTNAKKQIEEARDDFFREARTQFYRSRDDFSTDFIPNNLLQKIDTFINSLEPVVNRVNNSVGIQLQPANHQDLHTAMINFCQAELTQWGDRQWEEISRTFGGSGLEGLRRKAYTQLNCLPEFQLTNTFGLRPAQCNFVHHFKTTFNEVQPDISYNESSGDAFGGIAKIAMLTASTAITAVSMSPFAIIQGVTAISALGSFIGNSLSRPQQQKLKLEQVCDSLRRVSCNHYRNIARFLLSRVAQEIANAIDTEDRHFRKARELADEQIRGYFIETENVFKGYNARSEILARDRVAFEQIKRFVM